MKAKLSSVIGTFLCLIAITPVDSYAANDPVACSYIRRDGGLKETMQGVEVHQNFFRYRSEEYPFKTYSLAQVKEHSEWCFRYEIENVGGKPIRYFSWDMAGIRVDPFNPGAGNRVGNAPAINYSSRPPEVQPTKVSAFENTEAETRAHQPRQPPPGSNKQAMYVFPTYESKSKISPEIFAVTQVKGLPNADVKTYGFSEPNQQTHGIRHVLSGPGIELYVSSHASRRQESVQISTNISATGESASQALYFMPALRALNESKTSDYKDYIERVDRLLSSPQKYEGKWSYFSNVPPTDSKQNIYLVSHPIAVQHGGSTYCFRVETYSPFPIDYGLSQCPRN